MVEEGSNLPDGFAVAAAHQAAGRGQVENSWFSDYNTNILLSFFFRPQCQAVNQFVFNQCFALAVRRFVAQYVPDVKIKWPNDIYVNGKKIAGILIEHSIINDKINYSIAGVGVNVNQKEFPAWIPYPTSLYLINNQTFDIKMLTEELIAICREGQCSSSIDYSFIKNEYYKYLYLYQEYAEYEFLDGKRRARIYGIDSYGRLLLEEQNGNQRCCGMKEVRLCVK